MTRSSKKFDELLHDIKSPLTSAMISCEESLEIINGEKAFQKVSLKEYLSDIYESLQYIKNLICVDIGDEKFDITKAIFSSIKSAKIYCPDSCEVKFYSSDMDLSDFDCFLFGNKYKFKRVIDNIVINAIEALATVVEIRVKKVLKSIIIEIRDNGSGIPKDKLNFIFNKGFSTKSKSSTNRGLGLYICKSIIEKDFGGRISVESKIGSNHYTKFIIKV